MLPTLEEENQTDQQKSGNETDNQTQHEAVALAEA